MRRLLIGVLCLLLALGAAAAPAQTPKQKAEVEELIKIVKTAKDPKARVDALNELGELAVVKISLVRPAVPVLLSSLKDGDVEIRKAAINTLSIIEPYKQEWIPDLIARLDETEAREVRLAAVAMLGGVENGAPQAVPLLEGIAKKEADKAEGARDNELLGAAGQALEGIRGQLVGLHIQSLGKAQDAKQRAAAAAELAKIGQFKVELVKPAIPNLLAALKDESAAVRRAALGALAAAQPEPQDLVPALVGALRNVREERDIRLAVIGYLGALGPVAADALPFLEVIHDRESKKPETQRDKELFEQVAKALEAIKKQ